MQVENAKDLDVVMQSTNCWNTLIIIKKNTTESLFQYYRDEATLNNANNTVDFDGDITNLSKFEAKITNPTNAAVTKDIGIAVSLKYLINF